MGGIYPTEGTVIKLTIASYICNIFLFTCMYITSNEQCIHVHFFMTKVIEKQMEQCLVLLGLLNHYCTKLTCNSTMSTKLMLKFVASFITCSRNGVSSDWLPRTKLMHVNIVSFCFICHLFAVCFAVLFLFCLFVYF